MRIRVVDAGRRVRQVSAGLLLAACVAALLLALRPPGAWHIPSCPVRELTNLECPGCGTLRSVHHLLQGRFSTAWGFNPLLIAVAPFFAVWLGLHVDTLVRGRKLDVVYPVWLGWVVLGTILVYGVVRNLPIP